MSLKESNMMELGTKAPAFRLPDTVSKSTVTFDDVKGSNGTVVMFLCNHCPYVIHVNAVLVSLAEKFQKQGVNFVAISSNNVEKYPLDSPDKMEIVAMVLQYPFPYLYDESQDVARAYDAACTPDIYVFDNNDRLYYRGRIDGSRPGNDIPLTGVDLETALQKLVCKEDAPEHQYPSAGCNIKWKD